MTSEEVRSDPDSWVVVHEGPEIPEDVLALASAAQATLGEKLAALRSLSEPFPDTVGPAAGDRWVADAATGRTGSVQSDDESPPSPDPEPESPGELTSLSASALLKGYGTGAFDPIEAVEACLARIDEIDGAVGAIVTRDATSARAQAARSAQRWRDGTARALEGVPIGVKDIIDTAGLCTAAGSPLFAGRVPSADATVVARLRQAGAVVLAKTTTPEFAFGDEAGDGVRNPSAPGRWAGGSSSGSAAGLAAGLFPIALGTDTGGSIRVPASYCGVSGLKPTFGRVPRDGVFGVSWTLDHVGPMARTVEDLGLVLGVIAGGCDADPYASTRPVPDYTRLAESIDGIRIGVPDGRLAEGIDGMRIGVPDGRLAEGIDGIRIGVPDGRLAESIDGIRIGVPDYGRLAESIDGMRIGVPDGWLAEGCSPGVTAALEGAASRLEQLGAHVSTVSIPHAELAGTIAWVITVVEFAAHHDGNMHRIGEFTPSAACRLAAGARARASDYLKALRARSLVQDDLDAVFDRVDVLVTAATPTSAPDPATFFDDGDRLWLDKVARNLLPFNVTGQPALVVPVGLDEGRPAAVQIVAPPHADALCLQVGAALQTATSSHTC